MLFTNEKRKKRKKKIKGKKPHNNGEWNKKQEHLAGVFWVGFFGVVFFFFCKCLLCAEGSKMKHLTQGSHFRLWQEETDWEQAQMKSLVPRLERSQGRQSVLGTAKGNEGRNEHSPKGFIPIIPPWQVRSTGKKPRIISSLLFLIIIIIIIQRSWDAAGSQNPLGSKRDFLGKEFCGISSSHELVFVRMRFQMDWDELFGNPGRCC